MTFKDKVDEVMKSHQAHTEGAGESWLDGMARIGEESMKREKERNAFLDKIITELEATDISWWAEYSTAFEIVRLNQDITDSGFSGEDNMFAKHRRTELKRRIVERIIIPAAHALIRAGIVKPTEKPDGRAG